MRRSTGARSGRGIRSTALAGALLLCGCASTPLAPPLWRSGLWCGGDADSHAAAQANAASLATQPINLFGRAETGWAIYAPRIQSDIATRCAPDRAGFAGALARWQDRHALTPSGRIDAESLASLKAGWQAERPFVGLRIQGRCPVPPVEGDLVAATPDEVLGDKIIRLKPAALAAYRRMTAAAKAENPLVAADPQSFKLFSGYRDPDDDAARCAREGDCQGVTRARCSAHRTGLALDLWVGAAPGYAADASADANRLFQSQTPAYLWLARHARRFGFVNYAFEPWHWEWTGAAS